MMSEPNIYDILIIGGGPAGATAAVYGARAGHTVLVLEKMLVGGEIVSTERLDNYTGFPDGISGPEFGRLLGRQLQRFSVPVQPVIVEQASFNGAVKKVVTSSGDFAGRTAIIASGTIPNLLNVPGEEKLKGRGVSYCATCDAMFFRNRDIAVVGGGDAALEEAIFLAGFARRVYILHRRNAFRGVKSLQDRLLALPNVEVLWKSTVIRMEGREKFEGLRILRDGAEEDLMVQGVFVYVGRRPNTGFVQDQVALNENGYVLAGEKTETSLPGVYAAGDVRVKELRQVITAAADGAVAATMASRFLHGL